MPPLLLLLMLSPLVQSMALDSANQLAIARSGALQV
jgi:hypothetical protein